VPTVRRKSRRTSDSRRASSLSRPISRPVEYDAEKTNVQNIIKGFKKIKYEASEVKKDKENKKK